MRISHPLATLATSFLFALHSPVHQLEVSQGLSRDELASIHRLRCVFSVSAIGSWEGGQPQGRVKTEGVLSLQIDTIEAQDGSARLSGAGASDSHVVARLSDRSLHFLETDVTGSLSVTTVFAQRSRQGRLKAVHSRTSFLPVDLPGFSAEPSVSQFYGECELR